MKKLHAALVLILVPVLLSACAVGNKYDYRMASMPLPVKGEGVVGLKVADERPYILNGDKTPDFVGLQRGGFGNPFDVTTASGKPMAQDMADTLKAAMEDDGFRVIVLTTDNVDGKALAEKAKAAGARRVILLLIKNWKTDVALQVTLHYDLHLFIYDDAGNLLAENSLNGVKAIGAAGMPSAMGGIAQNAFEQKMSQLFYPPEVRAALATDSQ